MLNVLLSLRFFDEKESIVYDRVSEAVAALGFNPMGLKTSEVQKMEFSEEKFYEITKEVMTLSQVCDLMVLDRDIEYQRDLGGMFEKSLYISDYERLYVTRRLDVGDVVLAQIDTEDEVLYLTCSLECFPTLGIAKDPVHDRLLGAFNYDDLEAYEEMAKHYSKILLLNRIMLGDVGTNDLESPIVKGFSKAVAEATQKFEDMPIANPEE